MELKVWWIPQIPSSNPFEVKVNNIEEAKLLLKALADYDIYQFENKIKSDYSNAGGLMVLEDGEWTDYYDLDGRDIDELMEN